MVALIIEVILAGMKTACKCRKMSTGSWYNRRLINNLRRRLAGAKIDHYLHRHLQGENVKSFVLLSGRSQNDLPAIELGDARGHLS